MQQPELTLIEYPGIVENPERAMSTLKYVPAKAAQDGEPGRPESFLLNFRPDDRFHQPIEGTMSECKDKMLVKVRITRPASKLGFTPATKVDLIEVIGPVKKIVRFKKMSPLQSNYEIQEDWADLPDALQSLDMDVLREYAQRITDAPPCSSFAELPPPITSHFDFPVPILGPDMTLSVRSARPKKTTDIRGRLPWLVSFEDPELPLTPSPDALTNMVRLQSDTISKLKQLFEERPIVTRQVVAEKTGIASVDLAKILPVFAYCFHDGPWRNCWVQYGLDPRWDPKYGIFQSVQCRNNFIAEGLAVPDSSNDTASGSGGTPSYLYTGESAGTNLTLFQFLDIQYKPIAELIASCSNLQTTCHKRDGWYPNGFLNKIRSMLRKRWLEILQTRDPEGFAQRISAARAAKKAAATDRTGKEVASWSRRRKLDLPEQMQMEMEVERETNLGTETDEQLIFGEEDHEEDENEDDDEEYDYYDE